MIDNLGGGVLPKSIEAARFQGVIVAFGFVAGLEVTFNIYQFFAARKQLRGSMGAEEDVQNSVETRGSPELVVYAAWAWAGGGGDSLPSWSSNFGKCR